MPARLVWMFSITLLATCARAQSQTVDYRDAHIQFRYPEGWTIGTNQTADGRYVGVSILDPGGHASIIVAFRTAGPGRYDDSLTMWADYSKVSCDLGLEVPSPRASPQVSAPADVQSIAVNGRGGECIRTVIFVPPPPPTDPRTAWRSSHFAVVLYFHDPSVDRTPWDIVVRTFQFTSIPAGSTPVLSGRWEGQGYGVVLHAAGTFTEYYFGASVSPTPERTGTYSVQNDRIRFAYDRFPAGRLPSEPCRFALTGQRLTLCNGTSLDRRP